MRVVRQYRPAPPPVLPQTAAPPRTGPSAPQRSRVVLELPLATFLRARRVRGGTGIEVVRAGRYEGAVRVWYAAYTGVVLTFPAVGRQL